MESCRLEIVKYLFLLDPTLEERRDDILLWLDGLFEEVSQEKIDIVGECRNWYAWCLGKGGVSNVLLSFRKWIMKIYQEIIMGRKMLFEGRRNAQELERKRLDYLSYYLYMDKDEKIRRSEAFNRIHKIVGY